MLQKKKSFTKFIVCPKFPQIIKDNAIVQLKNEADIQTVCGHNTFIVELIAFWQSRREIYLRMYTFVFCFLLANTD